MARLDLFLRNTGLLKQRSEAKRACASGRVQIAGKPAKASHEIRIGEIISLATDTAYLEAEVLDIPNRPAPRSQRQRYVRVLRREARDPWDELRF